MLTLIGVFFAGLVIGILIGLFAINWVLNRLVGTFLGW